MIVHNEPLAGECWWRVEDHLVLPLFDDSYVAAYDASVQLYVVPHRVVRHTPKGVWLEAYGREKFVLREARKKWAHPTKKGAMVSFRKRKARQVVILRAQLQRAERALEVANAVED
jgi:hypothetical protein